MPTFAEPYERTIWVARSISLRCCENFPIFKQCINIIAGGGLLRFFHSSLTYPKIQWDGEGEFALALFVHPSTSRHYNVSAFNAKIVIRDITVIGNLFEEVAKLFWWRSTSNFFLKFGNPNNEWMGLFTYVLTGQLIEPTFQWAT